MELLCDLDLGSLSDDDLRELIGNLAAREKAVSRERHLLHEYLDLLGVKRGAHLNVDPAAGWIGQLIAREDEVSYERSLVQGRLDILRAEVTERRKGRSLAALGAEALVRALSRHGGGLRPQSAE